LEEISRLRTETQPDQILRTSVFIAVPIQLRLRPSISLEKKGVVYTKPWVVDLILDLAGYRATDDLARRYAVEPAAGEGAFLLPMIGRLLDSLTRHRRRLTEARGALRAYELEEDAAALAVDMAAGELRAYGSSAREALKIAEGWVTIGDYLLASHQDRRADVIVGNPPYIRYDDVPTDTFTTYSQLLPTMVGRCDIYVGFIEAGIRQLTDGGALGFICADRWMRSAYGAELRRFIAETCGVEAVIEMHNAPAFEEEVSAYPAVIIIRRGPQTSAIVASAGATAGPPEAGENLADAILNLVGQAGPAPNGFSAARVDHWFAGDAPWPSVPPDRLRLLQRLEERYEPLEHLSTGTKVGIGVATGADGVFVTTDSNVVEADRLVPLAMSRDTRGGKMKWSGHYLVDPWKHEGGLVNLAEHPKLRAYFEAHRAALEDRSIARRSGPDWYRTIDRVTHQLVGRHKLYFPDLKLVSNPTLDRGETYPHHNLYYVTSEEWDLSVLGGLLLSRVAQLFIEAYCVKMRGGTLRFQAQYLRRIRVPRPEDLSAAVADRLRCAFEKYDHDAATEAAILAYDIGDHAHLLI
jgi:adenine-specific DNA-methyltransferase